MWRFDEIRCERQFKASSEIESRLCCCLTHQRRQESKPQSRRGSAYSTVGTHQSDRPMVADGVTVINAPVSGCGRVSQRPGLWFWQSGTQTHLGHNWSLGSEHQKYPFPGAISEIGIGLFFPSAMGINLGSHLGSLMGNPGELSHFHFKALTSGDEFGDAWPCRCWVKT